MNKVHSYLLYFEMNKLSFLKKNVVFYTSFFPLPPLFKQSLECTSRFDGLTVNSSFWSFVGHILLLRFGSHKNVI